MFCTVLLCFVLCVAWPALLIGGNYYLFCVAEFTRSNVATNVTAEIGSPLVLNCPIYSAPAANVTWFFNDTPIDYGAANRWVVNY